MNNTLNIDDLIDALFSENKIFNRIKWAFLLVVIGIGLGYAWAFKVFH
ncbi:MAG: hypothetical protein HY739_13070 [Desulfobacterales bacterium]|nr:hypothetical protein [Desulfobacterales bacterium]